MQLLVREQFTNLRRRIHHVRDMLATHTILRTQVDLEAILNSMEYRLYSGELRSIDDLAQLIDAITVATQRAVDILGAGGHDAPVRAHMMVGSDIDADGDVILDGPGAEQTVMRSRGYVQANNLRDVRAISSKGIRTESAVASTPGSLLLEVVPGGQIRVGMAVKEVEVRVGNWNCVLPPESRNILIESDSDGHVRSGSDRSIAASRHVIGASSTI